MKRYRKPPPPFRPNRDLIGYIEEGQKPSLLVGKHPKPVEGNTVDLAAWSDLQDELERLRAEFAHAHKWGFEDTPAIPDLIDILGDDHDEEDCDDLAELIEEVRVVITRLRSENERLRAALVRAKEDMEGWGAYASSYFQERWGLTDDLAAIDDALAAEGEE